MAIYPTVSVQLRHTFLSHNLERAASYCIPSCPLVAPLARFKFPPASAHCHAFDLDGLPATFELRALFIGKRRIGANSTEAGSEVRCLPACRSELPLRSCRTIQSHLHAMPRIPTFFPPIAGCGPIINSQ
ncbi:hypothetical protein MIND_00983600 [Mycena indigotica]|uniref:Uncharacterized protein n=1 Tax=Mycena indigotica TaxID=2126181 RepID=A0A8H6W0W2_9AGAR|nr:uncharacterized protein MIND_00983600 [Mycena indigotica]KAF7297498.1 hypothetical protein MIND_00983600 [Mycena indigotica]